MVQNGKVKIYLANAIILQAVKDYKTVLFRLEDHPNNRDAQFVGNEKFLMGNVDEGIVRPDIVDEFKCCNVYAKEKCRSCFAKFYCSGGCAANSYNCHGKIDDVYELGCELQKKRVECAIMIKAALADEEE